MNEKHLLSLLLRVGIAFPFLYVALISLFSPELYLNYLPSFLRYGSTSDYALLFAFNIAEILIAVWLLIGYRIIIPALISLVMLMAITLFNLPLFHILFRNVSIIFAALALAVMGYEEEVKRYKNRAT